MIDKIDEMLERLEILEMTISVVSEAADTLEKKLDQAIERFVNED
jgi:hypothetical protein